MFLGGWGLGGRIRKGTNGVSTNGVTATFKFFDRGTFRVLPLTYVYLPRSARAYLFPESVKNCCFRSGPISVDPICPQPKIVQGFIFLGGWQEDVRCSWLAPVFVRVWSGAAATQERLTKLWGGFSRTSHGSAVSLQGGGLPLGSLSGN